MVFPFSEKRYLVSLDPDLSQGLDVELAAARGMEGSLDGLNSDYIQPLQIENHPKTSELTTRLSGITRKRSQR